MLIVELSSFQLEAMATPALTYGIITSITPDHLDRYPSFEAYVRTKCRLSFFIKRGGTLFVTREVRKKYGAFFSPNVAIEEISLVSYLQLTKNKRYWEKLDREKGAFAQAIARHIGMSHAKVCRSNPNIFSCAPSL